MSVPIKFIIPFRHYGEIAIPEIPGVEQKLIFEWVKAQEILEATGRFTKGEIEELFLPKIIKSVIDIYMNPYNSYVADVEYIKEMGPSIDLVSFYFRDSITLTKWLIEYGAIARESIDEVSGDDEFYDYLPDFVEGFRIACKFAYEEKRWAEFYQWVQDNYADFYEEIFVGNEKQKSLFEITEKRNAFIKDVRDFITQHEFFQSRDNDDLSLGEDTPFNLVVNDEDKITTAFLCTICTPE